MCVVMWIVASVIMLAVCVSIHVFELILIWLGIFLTAMWVPAVVDSFATSFIVFLAGVTSYIGYGMGALSFVGAARYLLLICLLWIDVCLIYNFVLNATCSRYAAFTGLLTALGTLSYFTIFNSQYILTDLEQLRRDCEVSQQRLIERYVLHLLRWVSDLCDLRDSFHPPPDVMYYFFRYLKVSESEVLTAYVSSVVTSVCFGGFMLLCIHLLHHALKSAKREKKLRRLYIVTLTPFVFFHHIARGISTFVVFVIFCAAFFLVEDTILPRYMVFTALPQLVRQVIAFTAACLILGFLDCGEVIYDTILRATGFRDPPRESLEENQKVPNETDMT